MADNGKEVLSVEGTKIPLGRNGLELLEPESSGFDFSRERAERELRAINEEILTGERNGDIRFLNKEERDVLAGTVEELEYTPNLDIRGFGEQNEDLCNAHNEGYAFAQEMLSSADYKHLPVWREIFSQQIQIFNSRLSFTGAERSYSSGGKPTIIRGGSLRNVDTEGVQYFSYILGFRQFFEDAERNAQVPWNNDFTRDTDFHSIEGEPERRGLVRAFDTNAQNYVWLETVVDTAADRYAANPEEHQAYEFRRILQNLYFQRLWRNDALPRVGLVHSPFWLRDELPDYHNIDIGVVEIAFKDDDAAALFDRVKDYADYIRGGKSLSTEKWLDEWGLEDEEELQGDDQLSENRRQILRRAQEALAVVRELGWIGKYYDENGDPILEDYYPERPFWVRREAHDSVARFNRNLHQTRDLMRQLLYVDEADIQMVDIMVKMREMSRFD
jgi:hypothetical protein